MRWAGSGSPSSRVRSVITSWMSRLMPAGRGVSDGSRSAWSVTVPVVPAAGCGRLASPAVAGFGCWRGSGDGGAGSGVDGGGGVRRLGGGRLIGDGAGAHGVGVDGVGADG